MYNIIVDYKLGEYVKDRVGKIYEITKVNVGIAFSIELKKDVAQVHLELVDAKDPWSQLYVAPAYKVQKATEKEVDDYIYNNTLAKGGDNFYHELNNGGILPKQRRTKMNNNIRNNQYTGSLAPNKSKEERTIDDILDEVNDYKGLIKNFGDEEGEYQARIDELAKEFEETSAKEMNKNK